MKDYHKYLFFNFNLFPFRGASPHNSITTGQIISVYANDIR